jgi:molybdopterin molybdotransferase
MGHGAVVVRRRPRVAVLSTGDELVAPGALPGPGQVVACNQLSVAALAEAAGAEVRQLGIARDEREDLARHFSEAADADILVTIGGVSVGDHDLVGPALSERGLVLAFWKIAMRPGKPLMFGRMGGAFVLGLPGNPASAFVGARLFLVPLIWRLLGRAAEEAIGPVQACSTVALEPGGTRQRYLNAVRRAGSGGRIEVTPLPGQHSSLIAALAAADCLLVRPPHAPALTAGSMVPILPLDV